MAVITSEPIEQATELLQNLKIAATTASQEQAQAVETSDSESTSTPGQDDNSSDSSSSDSGRQEAPAARPLQAQKPAQQAPSEAQGYAGEQLHGPGFIFQPLRFGYASPPPYVSPMSPVAGDGCLYAAVPYQFPPGPHASGVPYLPSSSIDASFAGEPSAPFVSYPPMMVAGEPVFGGEPGFYGQPHLPACMSPPMMLAAGDRMEAFGQQRPGFGYPRSVVQFDRPAWQHDPKASGKASQQQQKTVFHTVMPTQSFRPSKWQQRPPMMAPPAFGRGYVPYGKAGGDPGYSLYGGYETEGKGFAQFVNGSGGAFDVMNEQIRGPRASRGVFGVKSPADSKKSETLSSLAIEQYNRSEFVTTYEDAKFFVIKSYSEDDVHKSIKYGVWASTPKGNRRLDAAYKEAQSRIAGKEGATCPVFLFFSVNASGQFCGVAEMCGPVDFVKSMEFWQQEKKWNGFFAVKWHFIKDVPNRQFRHILLENNDNDPVTNSRDTQEVKLKQGNEMLSIFKKYSSKLSLLDDFQYYEARQKTMQDRRSRQEAQRPGEKPAAAAAEVGKVHVENGRSDAVDVCVGKAEAVSTPSG